MWGWCTQRWWFPSLLMKWWIQGSYGFLCPHGSRYPPTKLLTCFSRKQKSAKRHLPNDPPRSSRSICRSSLLHFGGCFELWLLYRWNVHENWWEIIGSELARCTSNHREGNFGHAEKVGDSFCLFVGHQGWMLSVFFGGGRGLIRLWIICL